ncbi:MAG TPA: DNA gyrase C-terminal beta-propeller domain-containing protein, partial [Allocoleopsis sp.]
GGRILKFPVNVHQLPIMGKVAQGSQGISLGKREKLIDCMTMNPTEVILLISQQGYGKKLPINNIRSANRGDIGTQVLQFANKTDMLAGVLPIKNAGEIIVITSHQRMIKIGIDKIKVGGKEGTGDRILELNADERIINIFKG